MERINYAAIIVAAGSSTRMGFDKMTAKILGKSVIERTVCAFLECTFIDEIIVVCSKENKEAFGMLFKTYGKNIEIVCGGDTRGESVQKGLFATSAKYVLIHDGARPFITKEIIKNVLDDAENFGASVCGVKCKDSVKQVSSDGFINKTIERKNVMLMQTPQCFERERLIEAYKNSDGTETDDCEVLEKSGERIKITEGSYENIKLTTTDDMITAEAIAKKREQVIKMRIGTGFDSHRLAENRPLIIGGVTIPYEKGLLGHSDADLLIHAIIDALFGAAAIGDIGTHFPDSDEKYKDISSMILLKEAARLIKKEGYEIKNLDATLIIEAPKMAPYITKMRENISNALGIWISQVSVKAKTNEKMGFVGNGEGVEARATVLIY